MDIISSINTAFTQVQRHQQMSVGSNGDQTRSQIRQHERVGQGNPFGQIEGGPGPEHNLRSESAVDRLRNAVHNAVAYDRTERGTLQLRTQEGDVVHLKFLNSESSNAQNQQFEGGGNVISNFSLEGGNSSGFNVVVEGDLNGEELNAIRDVLIQARKITDSFFNGDVKAAFEVAQQFDIDSEQLANANMRFSLQETYTYARAVVDSQSVQNPDAVTPGNQVQPVTPAVDSIPVAVPVNTDTRLADLTTQLSQPDLAAVTPISSESPTTATTPATPVHVAPDPADHLASALSTITDFLSQLSESIGAFSQQLQSQGSLSSYSFSNGFQLQMVSALVSQMELPSVEKPFEGHALAAATIDEVAVKMDAHVNKVV